MDMAILCSSFFLSEFSLLLIVCLLIFQISKKQHEIVMNMKQSGKSIQSKSLNRVLGNLNSFNVQPYEVFIEEEQKKLREHWLVCCK